MSSEPKRRILVVDADEAQQRKLGSVLADAGFVPVSAHSAAEALEIAQGGTADLILLDPDLPDSEGLDILRQLRAHETTQEIPVMVVTDRPGQDEMALAFELGTDDFVRKPVPTAELLIRIEKHLRIRGYVEELARKESDAQLMVELTRALASSLDFREILFTVVRRIADAVHIDRVSIVLAPEQDAGHVGYVVVASDDQNLSNLRIDLSKYPEIQQVLRTREALNIQDATTHPLLDAVRNDVRSVRVNGMTLLPIVWENQAIGVLFLRGAEGGRGSLSEREIGFCRVVANATAVALRNARVMQSLRDHTQQITFERFEAERRLRSLERYADLFDSSADGIAVADAEGNLLFANPRAYEILGHTAGSFRGERVKTLIHEDDRGRAAQLWAGFADGLFPNDVDLRLVRADRQTITCNVAFSSLLHGEGAVLFTFRDVTVHRQTEAELVQTKRFLESLIDASVDGIVAADMEGNILLFNKGAERIYGYRGDEVLGKMVAQNLYPGDGARQIMAMIRSPQHGGEGILESTRFDALNAQNERVPISLSASMIYDDGEPVATFGIFTDLREKIRFEQNLAHAQQKLAVTEKQALIAELAGTAAHELNQPLTSVMGYAEMLKRKLDRGSSEHHAADIIVREAERMADIVRKIGKITKYETKSYVGQQKILDLDKASGGAEGKSSPSGTAPSGGGRGMGGS